MAGEPVDYCKYTFYIVVVAILVVIVYMFLRPKPVVVVPRAAETFHVDHRTGAPHFDPDELAWIKAHPEAVGGGGSQEDRDYNKYLFNKYGYDTIFPIFEIKGLDEHNHDYAKQKREFQEYLNKCQSIPDIAKRFNCLRH